MIQNSTNGYTDESFPTNSDGTITFLTLTYYDTYGFPVQLTFRNHTLNISGCLYSDNVKGQITGIKTNVLGSSTWLCTTNYYDDKYRVIQIQHDLLEKTDVTHPVKTAIPVHFFA